MQEKQNEVIAEFSSLKDWEERYRHIIAIGKKLPELPENLKTSESLVKGCQSQVWLHAKLNPQGEIIFQGDSDALIVRGLVAILLKLYSGSTPQEILQFKPDFVKALGFESNLSPSRANGFFSMIKQIQYFATAFQYLT